MTEMERNGRELFFAFENFDREISKKLISQSVNADQLMEIFVRELGKTQLTPAEVQHLSACYRHLRAFPFDNIYHNYMTHPIRVAASFARTVDAVTIDDITLALCHNIRETGFAESIDTEGRFLTTSVRNCIETLTIDRAQERDTAYLGEFYDRIAAVSESLMLFKALDKLDNMLSYVQDDLESYHFEVVTQFVCPRVEESYPEVARYLRDLTHYVRTDAAKARFRVTSNI